MAAASISSPAHEEEPPNSRTAAAALLKIEWRRMTFTFDGVARALSAGLFNAVLSGRSPTGSSPSCRPSTQQKLPLPGHCLGGAPSLCQLRRHHHDLTVHPRRRVPLHPDGHQAALEKFGRHVDLFSESSPLPLCTKPLVLIRGHKDSPGTNI